MLVGYLFATALAIAFFEPGLTPPGFTGRGAWAMCVLFVGAFHMAGRIRVSWVFLLFGALGAMLLMPSYWNDGRRKLSFIYGYTRPDIAFGGWVLFVLAVAFLTRMFATTRWRFIQELPEKELICISCGSPQETGGDHCLTCGRTFDAGKQLITRAKVRLNWRWLFQRTMTATAILLIPYWSAASWLYWRSEQPLVDQVSAFGGHADLEREIPREWSVLPEIIQASFSHVTMVDFGNVALSDSQLELLAHFPFLNEIHFANTPISGKGLSHLKDLAHFEDLYMPESGVDDAGLVEICLLRHLVRLQLTGTAVTDAGIMNLVALRQLKCLWLERTAITDKGLLSLSELPNLSCVDVTGSQVTKSGVEKFKNLRPSVTITGPEPERQ